MKSILAFALSITTVCGFAQASKSATDEDKDVASANTNNANSLQTVATSGASSVGMTGTATFFNPKFDREGSIYLFEDWGQSATIYPKGTDQVVRENNMNFNIQRSMFETRVAGDSIVAYNFASIDKIVVGGRVFKSFYLDEIKRNKSFEVIYESDEFSILKGYEVDILEASPNPMIARPRDKYIQRATYYIETATTLEEFKLKKKSILAVLPKEQAKRAKDYSYKYDMSFSDESEVKMILNYASRILN